MDWFRASRFIAASGAALGVFCALSWAAPARAESCPGNPNALGTSRTLVVSPEEYQRLGTMQYRHTLPLADHEVVLTFDDGPLPPWSDKVLATLKSQCVKATFFIIGMMAQQFPEVVRREYEAGETVALHSQTHPLHFERLSGDKLNYQIDGAIASVSAALGDRTELAPFFRIPGLGRSQTVEDALAARSLVVFSADVVADDWFHHITAAQIVQRAMSRLEKRGSGILLLHDIHPWTVAALPVLLQQLKDHGFHVVQVVPAPTSLDIAGVTRAWTLASAVPQAGLLADAGRPAFWPPPNVALPMNDNALPAFDEEALKVDESLRIDFGLAASGADTADWPKLSEVTPTASGADLPVPGLRDIGVSLRGERLVGGEAAVPSAPVSAAGRHPRWTKGQALYAHRSALRHATLHHVRLRPHHPATRAGIDRHRA